MVSIPVEFTCKKCGQANRYCFSELRIDTNRYQLRNGDLMEVDLICVHCKVEFKSKVKLHISGEILEMS